VDIRTTFEEDKRVEWLVFAKSSKMKIVTFRMSCDVFIIASSTEYQKRYSSI